MKYYYQIEGLLRNNLGDTLQGLVGKTFLPESAEAVDRERLSAIQSDENGFLIANGWYLHSFENFPAPINIKPFYVSVHVAKSALLKNRDVRKHFLKNSPIGCRDKKTLKLFLGWGIPAYYSNCLTITSGLIPSMIKLGEVKKNSQILLVDNVDHPIPENVISKLEGLFNQSFDHISHDPSNADTSFKEFVENSETRMLELLSSYKTAKLIITSKIHCALPSLGINANVLFIHPNPDDPRLETVSEYLKVFSYEEILSINNIPENNINVDKLKINIFFLENLLKNAVRHNRNPIKIGNNIMYSLIFIKSVFKAKVYRLIIRILLATKIGSSNLERIFLS